MRKPNADMRDVTRCRWYAGSGEGVTRQVGAEFSRQPIDAVQRASSEFPSDKAGGMLVVHCTALGSPWIGLMMAPRSRMNESRASHMAMDGHAATGQYWNAFARHFERKVASRWHKDKWGKSWHVIPNMPSEPLSEGCDASTQAFVPIMQMANIDGAAILAAIRR